MVVSPVCRKKKKEKKKKKVRAAKLFFLWQILPGKETEKTKLFVKYIYYVRLLLDSLQC